jgi:hypothetical protein
MLSGFINTLAFFSGTVRLLIGLALILMMTGLLGPAWAEEVRSTRYRYGEMEMSTGYYSEYEVKPIFTLPGGPLMRKGIPLESAPTEPVRWRTYLTDTHLGIRDYKRYHNCTDCHFQQARDRHTVRAGITCDQCHGREPISGVNHYWSPLSPIRRHAYVCAKCHEGASVSYAEYAVHEPIPAMLSTRQTFPFLFFAFWMMATVAGGTFVVFLPHTALWGIRELLIMKKDRAESESKQQD